MNEILFQPDPSRIQNSQMNQFKNYIEKQYKLKFKDYNEFHKWSVDHSIDFWSEIFIYFSIQYQGNLESELKNNHQDFSFLEYFWFPKVSLNFAENLLRHQNSKKIALNFIHESGLKKEISYIEMSNQVLKVQEYLKNWIQKGSVVGAFMPNIPETIITMLATTSLGGIFTSTSCDFGVDGVVDRFQQSNPEVLVAVIGYEYNGKYIDLSEKIQEIISKLPNLKTIILVDFLKKGSSRLINQKIIYWDEILEKKIQESQLKFISVPFSSPVYIMYSSGTTGKPKCIVHSVGGTLVQHIKELGLHIDLKEEKNIFFFTTCGWMMWNWLISSLFFGSTITLYEGSPSFPNIRHLFELIGSEKINIFGTSPKFLKAYEDSKNYVSSFSTLETILSTGSPLLPEQFDFVYSKIKNNILLGSISGGTDILGCFMLCNPTLPVRRGEIQCIGLGMDVASFDEEENEVFNQEGELVCKKSFPSRPIYFLNDPNLEKFKSAYFKNNFSTWYHGDYVKITDNHSVVVMGRSDATLNPGGVRIGTAEIYRQTEQISFIEDSICVGKQVDGDVDVLLFVKLKSDTKLNDELIKLIKDKIRSATTNRHVPKSIHQVTGIPYTRSGKKMELAVSKIINGKKLNNLEAVMNPESLNEYESYF